RRFRRLEAFYRTPVNIRWRSRTGCAAGVTASPSMLRPLDGDLLDFDPAVRLETPDQLGTIALVALDERIGLAPPDRCQPACGDALRDEVRLHRGGAALRELQVVRVRSEPVGVAGDVHVADPGIFDERVGDLVELRLRH